MAEAILRSKRLPGIEVRSAGVYAANGAAASPNSIMVMDENQISHSHQSRLLVKEGIDWATVILAMTLSHKQVIIGHFPDAKGKTYTLKEFAGEEGFPDVGDPFGGDLHVYRDTFLELAMLIEKASKKLMELEKRE